MGAASFCHTAVCVWFVCVCVCVCVCHCSVCVSSVDWASHKQMGSWKATSHIVTEEIPSFCPQSWRLCWPRHTAQARANEHRSPSLLFPLRPPVTSHKLDQFTQITKTNCISRVVSSRADSLSGLNYSRGEWNCVCCCSKYWQCWWETISTRRPVSLVRRLSTI